MNGAEYPELDGGITVHSSSQYALSFLRLYIDREQNFIFPHLTAIIDVKDGVSLFIFYINCNIYVCIDL